MHRSLVLVLLSTVLSSTPCLAQDSPQLRACLVGAITQAAINDCAGDEATRVDAELNSVYQKLLAGEHDPNATAASR